MSERPGKGLANVLQQAIDAFRPASFARLPLLRLTIAAAVISELLQQHGMVATLVGGGAIELYAPGVYTTSDLDFVVEGGTRAALDAVLRDFGFERRGRHWVLDHLFLEVPGNWMSDPVEVITVGPFSLRVVRQEVVLADRIIGFKHWRTTAYGAQAVALLQVLGASLDDRLLRKLAGGGRAGRVRGAARAGERRGRARRRARSDLAATSPTQRNECPGRNRLMRTP